MSARPRSALALALVCAAATPALVRAQLPGTPLGGAPFGAIHMFDGYTVLPGPVVPGDLVMLESPTGGLGRSNWSNVIRFFSLPVNWDIPGVPNTLSVAFHMSDDENGLGSIRLVDLVTGNVLLADALAANRTFIQEIQVGTGTDADVTTYSPFVGTSYLVHSDAALVPELPEPVVAQPGTLPGPGPKGFASLTMKEGLDEESHATLALMTLTGTVGCKGGPDAGDEFKFTFIPGMGVRVDLSSTAGDASPGEAEACNLMGDETTTGVIIGSIDPVPEPSSCALVLTGVAVVGGGVARRRTQRTQPA